MPGVTMFPRHIRPMRRALSRFPLLALICFLFGCSSFAGSSATLLLEEPYGKLGFFTATGHAAVYLSGVCAQTPVVLRPCEPGETGVVISRYDGMGGYDWVAIPLIPYLYAVEHPEDVPLFADAKMVAFLRDRYRRKYLEAIVPDANNGETPGGNWYELVGSSYDRTIYGFEIETTPEQDEALIRRLNSSPNQSHFRTVSHNCADFAKDIINFYYPKALHRSIVADIGIATPKQMAKMLVKFNRRHPEIGYSRFLIAQVPGSMPRSSVARGVVESFFKSKIYIVPSAVASPIFAGCVFAVYEGTGGSRFDPSRDAMVLEPDGSVHPRLARNDLRAYQHQLKSLLAETHPVTSGQSVDKAWSKVQAQARMDVDNQGRPILQIESNGHLVHLGASADNVLNGGAPTELTREFIEARLQSELRRGSARDLSGIEVARDWKLLEQTASEPDTSLTAHSTLHSEVLAGNRP
jgi:hypothetical protein